MIIFLANSDWKERANLCTTQSIFSNMISLDIGTGVRCDRHRHANRNARHWISVLIETELPAFNINIGSTKVFRSLRRFGELWKSSKQIYQNKKVLVISKGSFNLAMSFLIRRNFSLRLSKKTWVMGRNFQQRINKRRNFPISDLIPVIKMSNLPISRFAAQHFLKPDWSLICISNINVRV